MQLKKAKNTLWLVTALVEMHSARLAPEIRVTRGTIRARGAVPALQDEPVNPSVQEAVPIEATVFEEDRAAIRVIFETVSARFGISREILLGQQGPRRQVLARHLCFYLMRKLTGLSLAESARQIGHHHTSLMHGIAKIERMAAANVCFRDQLEDLMKEARRRLAAATLKKPAAAEKASA